MDFGGYLMKYFSYVFICMSFLFSQDYVLVNKGFTEKNITPNIRYLEDKDGSLSIEDVASEEKSYEFKINRSEVLNFGRTSSVYWIKVSVDSYTDQTLFLEQTKWYINHLDLYLPKDNGGYERKVHGSLIPFTDRDVRHKNLVFRLHLKKEETRHFYLRYESQQVMEISLWLQSFKTFSAKNRHEQMAFGVFNGVIFIILIFNLFMVFTFKDSAYTYYIGFIVSLGTYFATLNGIAFEYLWPSSPTFNFWATTIFSGLSSIFLALFTVKMLNVSHFSNLLEKLLYGTSALSLIFVLSPLALPTRLAKSLTSPILGITLLIVLITGVYITLKKYKPAYYFLIAWGMFLLGAILMILRAKQILPSNAITQYSVQAGAALQMILLSLALSNKINTVQEERQEAMENKLKERKRLISLSSVFEKFVPNQFLKLLNKEDILQVKLGDHVEREMTVMFSEIRSFAEFSSQMTPEESFQFLNEYLAKIEPIIEQHNGFIDKYMGSSLMVLFENVDDSVRASIDIMTLIDNENKERNINGLKEIYIGFGINTGHVMLGTVGGVHRMQGTVISDVVNTAYRIQHLTNEYKTSILISEESLNQISEAKELCVRVIDRVVLKGKKQQTTIYEVFNSDSTDTQLQKQQTKDMFEEAVVYFQKEKFVKAYELFSKCNTLCPEDSITLHYLKRCEAMFEEIE